MGCSSYLATGNKNNEEECIAKIFLKTRRLGDSCHIGEMRI